MSDLVIRKIENQILCDEWYRKKSGKILINMDCSLSLFLMLKFLYNASW